MSAEWFDNGLIVRHPAHEETSAKGSQPYGKVGSPLGAGRSAPASFLPRAFCALRGRCVVVLDTPAGLLAVPVKGSDTPSALSLLVARLKLKRQRALVVHRIDRFASGALLFAKTAPDRDALVRQFLAHTPVRKYLAVLRGRLGGEAGTLVHYFRREG